MRGGNASGTTIERPLLLFSKRMFEEFLAHLESANVRFVVVGGVAVVLHGQRKNRGD